MSLAHGGHTVSRRRSRQRNTARNYMSNVDIVFFDDAILDVLRGRIMPERIVTLLRNEGLEVDQVVPLILGPVQGGDEKVLPILRDRPIGNRER